MEPHRWDGVCVGGPYDGQSLQSQTNPAPVAVMINDWVVEMDDEPVKPSHALNIQNARYVYKGGCTDRHGNWVGGTWHWDGPPGPKEDSQ